MSRMRVLTGILACLVVLVSAPARAGSGDTTTGLVGWWKLDETSGTTVIDYASSNNGTWTGSAAVVPEDGIIDGGFGFYNEDDHRVEIGTPVIGGSQSFSMSFWVSHKMTGNMDNDYIFGQGNNSSAGGFGDGLRCGFIAASETTFRCGIFGTANLVGTQIDDEEFHHLVWTYDEPTDTSRLYHDGVLVDTETEAVKYSGFGTNTIIGAWPLFSTNAEHDGIIDDVRIYNRPLTADDITALYIRSDKYCDTPTDAPGIIRYNADRSALQYCDGDTWTMMGLGSYTPVAVTFADDRKIETLSGLAGVTDSKKVTASFWYRMDQTFDEAGAGNVYFTSGSSFRISMNGASQLAFGGANAAGTTLLQTRTNMDFTDKQWHHVMFSFDLSDPAKRHIYVDGSDDAGPYFIYIDDLIYFSINEHYIGGNNHTTNDMYGDLADLWLDFGTYIDFSSATLREKFISANGMPMYLGPDGSLPTGRAPDIFLSGDVADWHTNKGTAGGFTPTGALTYASAELLYVHTPNLTTGLVGHWKLDEASGTTAADSSGNGNDGTVNNGPAWSAGTINGALDFEGSSDHHVDLGNPAALQITGEISVSAWINPRSNQGAYIVSKLSSANRGYDLSMNTGVSGTSVEFRIGGTGDCSTLISSGVSQELENGNWYHVTGVYVPSTALRIYVNGSLASEATSGIPASICGDNVNNLAIADRPDQLAVGQNFDGQIDDVRVYDRALMDDEIEALALGACEDPDGVAGTIIYNTDYKVMQYCNGRDWVAMSKIGGTGGGGCANGGVGGDILFNSVQKLMQYCNSEDWVAIGKEPPPAGLVGYWKLDETSGTTAFDYSGFDNHGTMQDMTGAANTVPGQVGTALYFPDVADIITVADTPFDITGAMTLSVWVKHDGTSNGNFAGKMDTGAGEFGYHISSDAGLPSNVEFKISSDCNSSLQVQAADYLNDATWYHVVGVYQPSAYVRLYVNGVLVAEDTSSAPASMCANDELFAIGQREDLANNYVGSIDEVRIYDRALSAGEVADLYLATGGSF